MAVTNGYASADELKTILDIGDAADDAAIERALNAASRLVDRWCGQRFWKDTEDTTRYLTAQQAHTVLLASAASDLDTVNLLSVTSLALDLTGDGAYGTSWTEDTEYFLAPRAADTSGRPYTQLRTLNGRCWPSGPEAIKIVGRFGWPSVPDEVVQATLIQASVLFKRATEGAAPIVTMDGATLSGGSKYLDREAQLLLRPYQLPVVA